MTATAMPDERRCSLRCSSARRTPMQWERFERQLALSGLLPPSGAAARPGRRDRRGDRRGPHDLLDGRRAGRDAAEVLRQPPRGRLPVLRGGLPRRRVPARGGRAARRQGRAGVSGGAPDRVRDADGAELRSGALAPGRRRTARRGGVVRAATRRSAGTACGCHAPRSTRTTIARLGEPICPDCFDYEHAVLWNALAPELWRRTAIQLPRELARLTGVTHRRLRERVRVSYVKVAEYQAPRRAALPLSWFGSTPRSRRIAPTSSSRRRRSSPRTCSPRRSARQRRTRRRRSPRPPDASTPVATARDRGVREAPRLIALGPAGRRARARARRGGVVRGLHREVRDQEHRGGRRAAVPAVGARPRAAAGAARMSRGWCAARGTWRRGRIFARCGCGAGRTRSASAGTASRRAAATRRRSRGCARRATSTSCARRTAANGATRGAGR